MGNANAWQLYIFDEWAADQEPGFKRVFYHSIVPALKARGKAVVVISHDDRYFHLADQMVVMESGRLISTERNTPGTEDKGNPALAV
jgi:putative pyoverdin transport system ATP-binding/permease protein